MAGLQLPARSKRVVADSSNRGRRCSRRGHSRVPPPLITGANRSTPSQRLRQRRVDRGSSTPTYKIPIRGRRCCGRSGRRPGRCSSRARSRGPPRRHWHRHRRSRGLGEALAEVRRLATVGAGGCVFVPLDVLLDRRVVDGDGVRLERALSTALAGPDEPTSAVAGPAHG